jgi:class III poly(R)-hydroxyalkanoic acid synthase PhaE subunit
MDKVFSFSPEGVAELTTQAMKLFEAMGAAKGYTEPWSQAMQKSMKALPQLLEGRPESIVAVFHDLFAAFDTTIGKVFHVPAVGKDREKVELLLRLADSLSVYMAKNTKYQYLMYATGMGAMDKVAEQMARDIKEGKKIKGFEEFFDLWLSVSEKRYLELFQTDDFSRLQGEFLDAALDVRRYFFKLVELYLYDTPIVARSEMDELYKTVYDLKKKVRVLEKQLKTASAQEVSA